MRRILALWLMALLVQILAFGQMAAACTIGVASGERTEDGRPVLWKSRMWSDPFGNHVVRKTTGETGYLYDFVGVKGWDNTELRMGVNTEGLATGNALNGGSGNSAFIEYSLGNFATVDEVRTYLQDELGGPVTTFTARSSFPFIDALGEAALFETVPTNPPGQRLFEYDCLDPDRIGQGMYGWVVRKDHGAHENPFGMDEPTTGDRYQTARENTAGLVGLDALSAFTVTQGNDGINDFEFLRYGPYRVLPTIAVGSVCSSMAVHGVHIGENPALTTMWTALGQANFAIAVPLWIAADFIPGRLAQTDMAVVANYLYNSPAYDEVTVQTSVFPSEQHLFDEVDELMVRWRMDYVGGVEQMPRVESRMTTDAYSLLDCLANTDDDNMAPTVTMQITQRKKTAPNPTEPLPGAVKDTRSTYRFEAIADDVDGTIERYRWDFGDDSDCPEEPVVTHTYLRSGWYLVSCTVMDDDDVETTDWRYLLVGQQCGGFLGIPCPEGEYCKYPDDTCDWADHFGVCTVIPTDCYSGGPDVCGCDDVTYENECYAEKASVSIEHDGACQGGE